VLLEVGSGFIFHFHQASLFFGILATIESSLLQDHAGTKDKHFYAGRNIE